MEIDKNLEITQQVMRGMVMAMLVSNKDKAPEMAMALQSVAAAPDIDEIAKIMLLDLSRAFEMFSPGKPM